MNPHHHLHHKVKDKVRVDVANRNHLYLLIDFDVMSGPISVSPSQYRVWFYLSSVWCPGGGQTHPEFDHSQLNLPLYLLPDIPLLPLVLTVVCSHPSFPRVRGVWIEILIPGSSLFLSLRSAFLFLWVALFVVCHREGGFSSWSCASGGIRQGGGGGLQ